MYEVFDEFEKATNRQEKISVLRNNYNYVLRCVLRATFHPNIKFVFSDIPKYKPDDAPIGLSYQNLHNVIEKIYLFELNNPRVSTNLTLDRKKILLMQILESLEAKEAKIFSEMLMKKLYVKGLTYKLVREALPELELPALP